MPFFLFQLLSFFFSIFWHLKGPKYPCLFLPYPICLWPGLYRITQRLACSCRHGRSPPYPVDPRASYPTRRPSLTPPALAAGARPWLRAPLQLALVTAALRRCSSMSAHAGAVRPRVADDYACQRSSPSRRGCLRVPAQFAVGARHLADACACQRSSLWVLAHACWRRGIQWRKVHTQKRNGR